MVDATPRPPFEDPCVVYKPLLVDGGLERYMSRLATVLDAPVYTASQAVAPDHAADVDVREFGDRSLTDRALARLPLGSIVDVLQYEHFAVPDRHDAVITMGEPAKAVVHRPHQRRYHLLNMPPRWLFDRGPGRFDDAFGPLRLIERTYQSALRVHDVSTTARVDDFVVPSETIGRRLETYYRRRASEVIYPPVETDDFYHAPSEGYLLYLGRLAAAKRVEEIVRTISNTDHELKVAGTGPLEERLRRIAAPNVDVLGYVGESRKRELLARCEALVFNSDQEAFGIVPVEAFASGKPVVGIDQGYTAYQIEPGTNGVRFERGGLADALERVTRQEWDPDEIRDTAARYDASNFDAGWRHLVLEGE